MEEKLLKIYSLIFRINETTNHDVMTVLIDRSIRISVYKNGFSKIKEPVRLIGRLDDRYICDMSVDEIISKLEDLLNASIQG